MFAHSGFLPRLGGKMFIAPVFPMLRMSRLVSQRYPRRLSPLSPSVKSGLPPWGLGPAIVRIGSWSSSRSLTFDPRCQGLYHVRFWTRTLSYPSGTFMSRSWSKEGMSPWYNVEVYARTASFIKTGHIPPREETTPFEGIFAFLRANSSLAARRHTRWTIRLPTSPCKRWRVALTSSKGVGKVMDWAGMPNGVSAVCSSLAGQQLLSPHCSGSSV